MKTLDQWFCGRAVNSGIESRYSLNVFTVYVSDDRRQGPLTSIAVTVQRQHTVAVLGTSTGHLLKVHSVIAYFAPGSRANYCHEYVSSSVCLSARISRKPHGQTPPNFVHMAVTRSSFDGVVIRYRLPVLWMTSRFHIMGLVVRHVYS